MVPPTSVVEPPLLLLFCLLPIPPNLLGPKNVILDGGARVKNIGVLWAMPANTSALSGQVSADQIATMNEMLTESGATDLSKVLVVRPASDGDFSTYTLKIVDSPDLARPPPGFDPVISRVDFGFKVECPSDFDCLSQQVCPPEELEEPVIDYMAKDYESFRSLMLDRLSLLVPDWKDRHAADMGVALVESLAYVGDQLSYYQDAVATEAYLGTARQRVSARRHSRLLDYRINDGCNARAWIVIHVDSPASGLLLPAGTVFLTGAAGDPHVIKLSELDAALATAQPFQTMDDALFFTSKNEIELYSWGDPECCIPAGGTKATLDNAGNALDAKVFGWSKVPGSDSSALQEFLAGRYGLSWPTDSGAEVTKSSDGKQIVISCGLHSATVTLGGDSRRASTVIDGQPVDEFVMIDGGNVPPNPATMSAYAHTVKVGDVLVFEEVRSPTTRKQADADPAHRFAVRLTAVSAAQDPLGNIARGGEAAISADAGSIVSPNPVLNVEWDGEDALPFALCLKTVLDADSGSPGPVTVARGNVVLVDHGCVKLAESFPYPGVAPPSKQYTDGNGIRDFTEFLGSTLVKGRFVPGLRYGPLTRSVPRDQTGSATSALDFDPRDSVPDILVLGEQEVWRPVQDLLSSSGFAFEFVAESDDSGTASLRFGDADYGEAPEASTDQTANPFFALYRVGNGSAGNVGRESITRVLDVPGAHPTPTGFPAWGILRPFDSSSITGVRNPMEARGGSDPESLEDIKQSAPQAFRTQKRAVTSADYEYLLLKYPGVQKAYARLRWTGSWYTCFVSVDRIGGAAVDATFRQGVLSFLDGYRLAGYDLEITNPTYAPLEIAIHVCVLHGYSPSDVKAALLDAFSNRLLPDGTRGFFHPDNFTFGQPVYLSQVYERALSVSGVDSAEVDTFQRWGMNPAKEKENGVIQVADSEIARLDNDANFPENGQMSFTVDGGST